MKQKIEWQISNGLVAYEAAVDFMEKRVRDIIDGKAESMIWLTEHPPIYTAGISAKDSDLLKNTSFNNIPVYKTGRGGKYTYHGPGMRIIYVMLDLKKLFAPDRPDIAAFVKMLENWIIAVLNELSIQGEIRPGRVGIWTKDNNGNEKKIAAIGIKLRKWVSYHGIALNINPDLTNFEGIVPCGISEFGVTSIFDLGKQVTSDQIDIIIKNQFNRLR